MPKVQNFSEHLERSLARVGTKVGEQMERPENVARPEREIVKESVREIAKEVVPADPLPATAAPASASSAKGEGDGHLPAYVARADVGPEAKQKIDELLHMALERPEGLEKAIRMAKRQPFFVEDAFHDALVDKLLPELKERGILKNP